jgi:6,7-dimethyl-8-ribityllumazine synthase
MDMASRKTESLPSQIEGALVVPAGTRFAIVASRFNDFIVQPLVGGARDALVRHGADANCITVVRVPGAWELPPVVARLARSKRFDAVIALGAVIRGGTPHFDYVAGAVSKGVFEVAMEGMCPVSFGVLTTDTIEQAVDRAGTKAGNKGFDAAVAAIEMVTLSAALSQAGL